MNMLVTSQYQPRLSSIAKIFSKRIIQPDCSIKIKLNYIGMIEKNPHIVFYYLPGYILIWYNVEYEESFHKSIWQKTVGI